MQWPMAPLGPLSFREREELIKYESDSNHITLLKRSGNEFSEKPNVFIYHFDILHITFAFKFAKFFGDLHFQDSEYLLQEASKDDLCSYVIAAPMTKRDVYSSLFFGTEGDGILRPAGFSILPDNTNFKSSLVTFAVRQLVNVSKTENEAVQPMNIIISCMIQDMQTELGTFLPVLTFFF